MHNCERFRQLQGVHAAETSKVLIAPMGKMADVLALTLACTTVADGPINYSMYVLQRTLKVPIAPMGKLLTSLPRLSLAQLRPTL